MEQSLSALIMFHHLRGSFIRKYNLNNSSHKIIILLLVLHCRGLGKQQSCTTSWVDLFTFFFTALSKLWLIFILLTHQSFCYTRKQCLNKRKQQRWWHQSYRMAMLTRTKTSQNQQVSISNHICQININTNNIHSL